MKGLIVFDTSYGNTKKIAETITETLRESGIEVDLYYVKDVKKVRPIDNSFLVLGSPTKFGTMSIAIKFFLGKVKGEEWADKPFAAFDTENPENMEHKEWSAAEKISEKVSREKDEPTVASAESCCAGLEGTACRRRNQAGKRLCKGTRLEVEGT